MVIFQFWVALILATKANCIVLRAFFSQNGIHGNITFEEQNGEITLETNFKFYKYVSKQNWLWSVHEFPVRYENMQSFSRCNKKLLGKQLYNLNDIFGDLILHENKTVKQFDDSLLNGGLQNFWGRSIVLQATDADINICSSIMTKDYENISEARFKTSVVGSIVFRSISSGNGQSFRTLIYSDLKFAPKNSSMNTYKKVLSNSWKIFTTDVFTDKNDDAQEMNCNNLQILYDPYNAGINNSIGDLDIRLGKLQISSLDRNIQAFVDKDLLLTLNDYSSSSTRKLYIVIFDDIVPNKYIACAKITPMSSKILKAVINGNGLKGHVIWEQKSVFEPTFVNVSLGSVYTNKRSWLEYARDLGKIYVSKLPPINNLFGQDSYCSNQSTGEMFNPTNIQNIPLPGLATQDEYPIGDLTGKLLNKEHESFVRIIQSSYELNGSFWDLYLSLNGPDSIVLRGLVITRKQQNVFEPWTCSTILIYDPKARDIEMKMTTANVVFKYPIVGTIFFSQPTETYWEDTTIIIEYLIHADGGSLNTTHNHRWAIHEKVPGKDFYDWQNRCISTGNVFNPQNLFFDPEEESKSCSKEINLACRMGDLSNNVGKISISGSRNESFISRKLFTLPNLPLGGQNKIIGRSIVIYDDYGPKARGERLACSSINYIQARKAVVKDWFGNGLSSKVSGKIEFTQQTQYGITNIEQALKGRSPNNLFTIHEVPVAINLEFPCETYSIEKIYNPSNINSNIFAYTGTLDNFEIGNLSGKFPTIGISEMKNESFTDNQMTLFGYNSIIGRSVIVGDKKTSKNIACGTIERGYSSKESREVRAIISFHHPLGFAYGYIRLSQLIGLVSGQSDTTIEVNLRYPGLHDRNKTKNHLFKIYVNPVGVDAVVKQTVTRCTAGGYVFNPFYTQLADPRNEELYKKECNLDNPFRCYVGDVSARVGTINIGYGRQLLTDPNFPLDGVVSAVGRSIVIFGPEMSTEIFACANIEPDHDIIKYVNIERPPRFVTAQFLEDVRNVLGVPEWFLEVDSRKTKLLYNNACVQIVIHFRGPIASRLEQDFSKMLVFGRLDSPSLYIPGYQNSKRKSTIQHKECSIKDGNKNNRKILKAKAVVSSASFFKLNEWIFCVSKIMLLMMIIKQ